MSAHNGAQITSVRICRESHKSLFGIYAQDMQKIHVSIKDLRVYANNPAKVGRLYYPKSLLRISAHVRKNFSVSIKIWHICKRTKSNNNGVQNTSTDLNRIII